MDPAGIEIISILRRSGHSAYFVGGCVRDALLGREVKDYDIATSADPARVMELFPRTVPTGLKHGTVTVLHGGRPFEVTTYRREQEYEKHRRPKAVVFVDDLHEDLKRRDFTINAMAMDEHGRVIDPFGGLEDLRNRRLRSVGDAAERFREDALRMLRCIRFAAEYGLDIEPSTWKALLENRGLLAHVAMERVKAELDRIVCGSDPVRGLRLLAKSGLFQHLKEPMPGRLIAALGAMEREAPAVDRIPSCTGRYCLLFASMGLTTEEAGQALGNLRFDNRSRKSIISALRFHALAPRIRGAEDWKRAVLDLGREAAELWTEAAALLPADRRPFPSDLAELGRRWLDEMPVFRVKDLEFGGSDAKAMGLKGERIGRLLGEMLAETALGRLPNEREALRGYAAAWIRERELEETIGGEENGHGGNGGRKDHGTR